ncbi:MAG: hypothetical protein GY827_11620 [Cytophagales bacterium]|nr:hypothetical protein [Cytophagales bacterium]
MENIARLKVVKVIDLPVHEISDSGKIKHIGSTNSSSFYLNGEDHIAFFDLEGNILKKIDVQKGSFGSSTGVFNFSHGKSDKKGNWEMYLTVYEMLNNEEVVSDKFVGKLKGTGYNFSYDGFMKVIQIEDVGTGKYIIQHNQGKWAELGYVPQSLRNKYSRKGAKTMEVNLGDNTACFVSSTTGDFYIYDYLKEEEINHYKLPLRGGDFASSHFCNDFKHYMAQEKKNGIWSLNVYDVNTCERVAFRENIEESELTLQHDKIVIVYDDDRVEVCSFPMMETIAEGKLPKKMENLKVNFTILENAVFMTNDDEAFIWDWNPATQENLSSYRDGFDAVLEAYSKRIEERWHEDDIKQVFGELKDLSVKKKLLVKKYFEKRYQQILGIRDEESFWDF